jgi:sterol desaturase/sphingolipid hydroxylase (fatty acid hydroxylase superfamily)
MLIATKGEAATRPFTWAAALGLTGAAAALLAWGVSDLGRAHLLWTSAVSNENRTVGPALLIAVAAIFVAERRWPAVPRPAGSRAHVVDAGYLALYALIAPAVLLLNTGFALAVERYLPFLVLGRMPFLPQIAVVAAILVGIDAVNWAAHVANHRSQVLWRFHALHHSQEDMSVFTTFRTHPLAHASYLPALLPVLVLEASGTVPTLGLIAYGIAVTLPHANLRWTYGPLGRWFVSPAFHRLHHRRGQAVNFGFVLSIWDRMAGTAVYPHGAVVATGIAGRPVPCEQDGETWWRVVGAQLAQPLRRHSGLDQPA